MSQCRDFDEVSHDRRYNIPFDKFYRGTAHFKSAENLPKSHTKSSKRDVPKQKPELVRDSFGKEYEYTTKLPHRGLNYKNRYGVTEVFTSVYDYVNFIYYILDLHQ